MQQQSSKDSIRVSERERSSTISNDKIGNFSFI
jgi:hypothetical protein